MLSHLLVIDSLKLGLVGTVAEPIVQINNLTIEKGESLGLVGESGSGKTLTALSIMKLLPKRVRLLNGHIIFDGTDLTSLNENQMYRLRGHKIGLVFQEPAAALDPLFTIGNQVTEALHFYRNGRERRERALTLLSEVGLPNPERVLNLYPHEMSGGMKQRVMIAIAIANNPELLIADEPTTALDATLQKQVLSLIHGLVVSRNISLLVISHDLNVVRYLCDRISVMYAGKIVESAEREELFNDPKHPYTQLLLASMLTNKSRDEQQLLHIKGDVPDPSHFPTGCRFHPRCPYTMDICRSDEPPLLEKQRDHSVACHLYDKS